MCLLDDDTIVVVGEPQVAVASLYDAREARCQRVFRDRTETRDGLVDLCCARLPVIACDAIGIESQPKCVAVGREERTDKVDGEGTWTSLQVIALKWRAVEGRLNDAIVLSEYPDIAAEVSGHPIAIVQAGAVDVGELLPLSLIVVGVNSYDFAVDVFGIVVGDTIGFRYERDWNIQFFDLFLEKLRFICHTASEKVYDFDIVI